MCWERLVTLKTWILFSISQYTFFKVKARILGLGLPADNKKSTLSHLCNTQRVTLKLGYINLSISVIPSQRVQS